MTDPQAAPAVALLFADAELGVHLRAALQALGARIVHEGPLAEVPLGLMAETGAEVVVVNLEPDEEDDLDRLYAALEDHDPRVVFNDAATTRSLSGWDRARWARHLAAKLVGSGDVDPPRPRDARPVEVVSTVAPAAVEAGASPSADESVPVPSAIAPVDAPAAAAAAAAQTLSLEVEAFLHEADNDARMEAMSGSAEDVDALAADELDTAAARPGPDPDSGLGANVLTFDASDDGAVQESADSDATAGEPDAADASGVLDWSGGTASDSPAGLAADADADAGAQAGAEGPRAPAPPADWGLVELESPEVADADGDAAEVAPEPAGVSSAAISTGLNLELVALDDSPGVAADPNEPVSEMLLSAGAGQIRQLAVLAAGSGASRATAALLAALPTSFKPLIIVVQHQGGDRVDALVDELNETAPVRVRAVTEEAVMVRPGQVWVVPPGYRVELGRGGRMSLRIDAQPDHGRPSIDHCLESLAAVFGADLTAIVLAGAGNDAAAGAARVSAHGGTVWIQDPDPREEQSMAADIQAAGLAVFSGSPESLAGRLCEVHT